MTSSFRLFLLCGGLELDSPYYLNCSVLFLCKHIGSGFSASWLTIIGKVPVLYLYTGYTVCEAYRESYPLLSIAVTLYTLDFFFVLDDCISRWPKSSVDKYRYAQWYDRGRKPFFFLAIKPTSLRSFSLASSSATSWNSIIDSYKQCRLCL
jgi:hypothetical protein